MRYLVTGATGFLGKKICKDLIEKGHCVRAQGRNKKIGKELTAIGCEFFSADLRDKEAIRDICSEVDVVIHSAALSSPWGKREDFFNINVIGTRNLIEAAINSGSKKIVYVSSTSVYFNFQDRFNITEEDAVAYPAPSLYTETKLLAEKEFSKYKDQIDYIIIRPRGIFGPGDTTLIPRIINAYDKGQLPIIGHEDVEVDITYVGNVSHACILASEVNLENNGEIFNITNGEPVKLWKIIKRILKECSRDTSLKVVPYKVVFIYAYTLELLHRFIFTKKEPTLTRYTIGLLSKSQTLSIEKAKKLLNYRAVVSMEDALNKTIDWYLKEGQHES